MAKWKAILFLLPQKPQCRVLTSMTPCGSSLEGLPTYALSKMTAQVSSTCSAVIVGKSGSVIERLQ